MAPILSRLAPGWQEEFARLNLIMLHALDGGRLTAPVTLSYDLDGCSIDDGGSLDNLLVIAAIQAAHRAGVRQIPNTGRGPTYTMAAFPHASVMGVFPFIVVGCGTGILTSPQAGASPQSGSSVGWRYESLVPPPSRFSREFVERIRCEFPDGEALWAEGCSLSTYSRNEKHVMAAAGKFDRDGTPDVALTIHHNKATIVCTPVGHDKASGLRCRIGHGSISLDALSRSLVAMGDALIDFRLMCGAAVAFYPSDASGELKRRVARDQIKRGRDAPIYVEVRADGPMAFALATMATTDAIVRCGQLRAPGDWRLPRRPPSRDPVVT